MHERITVIIKPNYGMKKPNIFWDMDGVIYPSVPVSDCLNGEASPCCVPGYYLNRTPIHAVSDCITKLRIHDTCSNYIISHGYACNETVFEKAKAEKEQCLKQHKIGISEKLRGGEDDPLRLICVPQSNSFIGSKAEAAIRFLKRPLTPYDVLIDDFNTNLEDWKEKGGTAIKYLNGENSRESWNGRSITITDLYTVPGPFIHILTEMKWKLESEKPRKIQFDL